MYLPFLRLVARPDFAVRYRECPTEDIPGCNFASRCPLFRMLDETRQAQCLGDDPAATVHGKSKVACHHVDESHRLDEADISALSPIPGD